MQAVIMHPVHSSSLTGSTCQLPMVCIKVWSLSELVLTNKVYICKASNEKKEFGLLLLTLLTFQSSENSYLSSTLGFHDFNNRRNKYCNFPKNAYMFIYWWKSKTIRHIKLNDVSFFQSKYDGSIDFNFKFSLFFIYYSWVLWSSFRLLLTSLCKCRYHFTPCETFPVFEDIHT